MLLSRFWYVVLALALGATTYAAFVATSVYNRASVRAMGESLAADSQVVASYLRDDARKRSSALLIAALDEDVRASLAKASAADKLPVDAKDKAKAALRKQSAAIPAELKFDALFAVDQLGRVVAQVGFDQASGIEGFELGGYPVVADALHGWVRDDAWVLDRRIYRVVARPVELEAGQMPAGAIVGARIVDDSYVRELSRRTGAAVGFYAAGTRVASGAPEGFDTAQLDIITNDLKNVEADATYKEKGSSDVRTLHEDLGVVYARLPGEAWDLGCGYAVARSTSLIRSPAGFLQRADDKDKAAAPMPVVALVAFLAAFVGIVLSLLEHTRPLHAFRTEVKKWAKGDIEYLTASKFRGAYRRLVVDLDEGIEKLAAKGGAPRRAADLQQVLGPIPAQPAMSAFAFPGEAAPSSVPPASMGTPISGPISLRDLEMLTAQPSPTPPPPVKPPPPKPPVPGRATPAPPAAATDDEHTAVGEVPRELLAAATPSDSGAPPGDDEAAEWQAVFQDFVRTKTECGEPTDSLTFEKFQGTLRKNRDLLMAKHACKRVKFSVYVKEGKAALKASPVKD